MYKGCISLGFFLLDYHEELEISESLQDEIMESLHCKLAYAKNLVEI